MCLCVSVCVRLCVCSLIAFNEPLAFVASVDEAAMVEFWDTDEFELPRTVAFESKLDTDLWEFLKVCVCVCVCVNGWCG